jgi:eukaryotic-like serine/threonine-protein kinase
MALTAGERFGPYEVTTLIGVGGMGEVYRATDTNLKRQVAIKVLPESLGGDRERLARFQREAEVLAALNHPNIAGIYGLERADGRTALVMELVEGPTLAERIAQGPIPVNEAVSVAKQIAEALEAAHAQGIIHRDLKPANLKVRADGTVKVLDLGLAKVIEPAVATGPTLSQTPTITTPAMTQRGVILGTASYMSPEQARGQPVDKRTDIWAFGCVLFEMLTGRKAYDGATFSDAIAAILEREPDWRSLPPALAPHIRRVLQRCLEKDARRRLHDIADGRIDLEDSRQQSVVSPSIRPTRPSAAWLVAALAILAAITAIQWPSGRVAPSLPVLRFDINTPPTSELYSFALSPDGRQLLFAANTGSTSHLWLRSLDDTNATALPSTEGASYPFWSPDSRAFAFFADGKLKRYELAGGGPQVLADAPSGRGGSWSPDGLILFAPAATGPLFRIGAAGGEATAITQPDKNQPSHRFPQFLPGDRHFIYFAGTGPPESEGIYLGSLGGEQANRLVAADAGAVFATPDHLLVARQGLILARRIDLARGEVGEPFPIAQPAGQDLFGRGPSFSVSTTGVLAHRTGSDSRQLVWLDRRGVEVGTFGTAEEGNLLDPAWSPDGQLMAVARTVRGNFDVWIHEMSRSVSRRLTFDAAIDSAPVWAPDGKRLAFTSMRKGPLDLYERAVNGADPERLLLATPNNKIPMDWSPDGSVLLYQTSDPKTGWDLWALPLVAGRAPFPVAETAATERAGQFSPDGKWIAYDTNESGRFEVSVQAFPGRGGDRQISTSGGTAPRWRRDGRELFYLAPDGTLMAVPVRVSTNAQTLEPGKPIPLFRKAIVGGGLPRDSLKQQYLVAPDGQRFLVNTTINEASGSPIRIVQNWMAGLTK